MTGLNRVYRAITRWGAVQPKGLTSDPPYSASAIRLGNHIRLFSSSSALKRGNVLAKYARPAFPPLGGTPSLSTDDVFITASTEAAGTSFQSIPPPDTGKDGSHEGKVVPAMIPTPTVPVSDQTTALDSSKAGNESTTSGGVRKKEIIVQGIAIPPKPIAPGEEDCCMSGCVHCVYTIYADDLDLYTESLSSARKALTAARVPESDWPEEVKAEGGGQGVKKDQVKKVVQNVDPAMAAFLALEAKMKKKHAPEGDEAQ